MTAQITIMDPCPEAIELVQTIKVLKHYSPQRLYPELSTLGIAKRELDELILNAVRAAG